MQKDRIQVSARISKELYDSCIHLYGNMKTAINTALEMLVKTNENVLNSSEKSDCRTHTNQLLVKTDENELKLTENSDGRFTQTEGLATTAENSLNSSENSYGELKARIEEKDSRIEDMKAQVKALYEQLNKKDEQLHVKDNQLEKLNENMHKQAVHIQTLIQENSRLNIKLLPETTESKKPWWKFW
jgi:chromosome segregation ATPase